MFRAAPMQHDCDPVFFNRSSGYGNMMASTRAKQQAADLNRKLASLIVLTGYSRSRLTTLHDAAIRDLEPVPPGVPGIGSCGRDDHTRGNDRETR